MAKSSLRNAPKRIRQGAAAIRKGKKKVGYAGDGVKKRWTFLTGEYICTSCDPHQKVRMRDKNAHQDMHFIKQKYGRAQDNPEKLQNVIAAQEREEARRAKATERRPSQVVAKERARKVGVKQQPAPYNNKPSKPQKDHFTKTYELWTPQINQIGAVIMGDAKPSTPAQAAASAGPASGIVHASSVFANSMPQDHHEMRGLMWSFDKATESFAKAVEDFQAIHVRRGFHPATMRPLDLTVSNLNEARFGFSRTIYMIETVYSQLFDLPTTTPDITYFGQQKKAG